MHFATWYKASSEHRLKGRYLTLEHLFLILKSYDDLIKISEVGVSELGKNIPLLKIGSGKKKVLGWSQMHGNESTTTKAIFDLFAFLTQKEYFQKQIKDFLNDYTLYIIPILNPDGATLYTRENANSIDLNRDAQALSQNESKVLNRVFKDVRPDLCLNLHDQRSIYGLETGKAATVSFLAPSADNERSITESRKVAMKQIVNMYTMLQEHIPGQVGRYDDSFNANCVGDTFQMAGVPTILFEAGHYKTDYEREKTREFIFYSFLELFGFTESENSPDYNDYFKIPENNVNYRDLILRNVRIESEKNLVDVCLQYKEVLQTSKIVFEAIVDSIEENSALLGHTEIDMEGDSILINSQEEIFKEQKVSLITNKSDSSVIIFPKKSFFIE